VSGCCIGKRTEGEGGERKVYKKIR